MKINEIFYSIQGEGYHSGQAAIFVRFSGCNLKCPFCDTNHKPFKEMTEADILQEISQYNCKFVVLTGGEPTLQVTAEFIKKLQKAGYYVAIETNGTRKITDDIDWITISPKVDYVGAAGCLKQMYADEVKVVCNEYNEPNDYGISADYYYLQPCDVQNNERNEKILKHCINFVKKNTKWKLSIQLQKTLKVR